MASDLISREALLATLNDLEATGGHKYYLKGANDVLHDIMPQILADAPAVDAVEVVRCKDCMHSEPLPTTNDALWCNEWATCTHSDGYCHNGCKMDGGKE